MKPDYEIIRKEDGSVWLKEKNPYPTYPIPTEIYMGNPIVSNEWLEWELDHANDPLILVLTPNALELLAGKDTVSGDEVTEPVWQHFNGVSWIDQTNDQMKLSPIGKNYSAFFRLTCHLKEQAKETVMYEFSDTTPLTKVHIAEIAANQWFNGRSEPENFERCYQACLKVMELLNNPLPEPPKI